MAARSIEERLDEVHKKQEQLKAKEKALKAKQSQAARKARTKRLIEVGAIVEKSLALEFDTQEKRDKLLNLLTKTRSDQNGYTYTLASWLRQYFDLE